MGWSVSFHDFNHFVCNLWYLIRYGAYFLSHSLNECVHNGALKDYELWPVRSFWEWHSLEETFTRDIPIANHPINLKINHLKFCSFLLRNSELITTFSLQGPETGKPFSMVREYFRLVTAKVAEVGNVLRLEIDSVWLWSRLWDLMLPHQRRHGGFAIQRSPVSCVRCDKCM